MNIPLPDVKGNFYTLFPESEGQKNIPCWAAHILKAHIWDCQHPTPSRVAGLGPLEGNISWGRVKPDDAHDIDDVDQSPRYLSSVSCWQDIGRHPTEPPHPTFWAGSPPRKPVWFPFRTWNYQHDICCTPAPGKNAKSNIATSLWR